MSVPAASMKASRTLGMCSALELPQTESGAGNTLRLAVCQYHTLQAGPGVMAQLYLIKLDACCPGLKAEDI